jgi:hypothetical protein
MAKCSDGVKRDCWRSRLAKFDSSDLTVVEFCRREQVSQASFYYWSKRLRECKDSKVPAGGRADVGPMNSQVEVENKAVEVVVGDSIRVRMPGGEPAAVAALIRHLQDAPHTVDASEATTRFQRIELTHRSAAK